jgi:hypothetical protein
MLDPNQLRELEEMRMDAEHASSSSSPGWVVLVVVAVVALSLVIYLVGRDWNSKPPELPGRPLSAP